MKVEIQKIRVYITGVGLGNWILKFIDVDNENIGTLDPIIDVEYKAIIEDNQEMYFRSWTEQTSRSKYPVCFENCDKCKSFSRLVE